MRALVIACCLLLGGHAAAALEPWTSTRFPQDEDKAWWNPDWWERGQMPVPANHAVRSRDASYRNADVEVPVEIFAPAAGSGYPVVVFLHGRRGLDELTRLVPLRIAARGFTVVAPDLFWIVLALTIPVVIWSEEVQHWLGYMAPAFPGSRWIGPVLATVMNGRSLPWLRT